MGDAGPTSLGYFGCAWSPQAGYIVSHGFTGALHLWQHTGQLSSTCRQHDTWICITGGWNDNYSSALDVDQLVFQTGAQAALRLVCNLLEFHWHHLLRMTDIPLPTQFSRCSCKNWLVECLPSCVVLRTDWLPCLLYNHTFVAACARLLFRP